MALTAHRYDCLTPDIFLGKHLLIGTGGSGGVHELKAVLTNTQPLVTHTVLSNVVQIANGHGYTTDGMSVQNVGTATGGVTTIVGQDMTWTTNDGQMATFQFMVVYNSTTATKALIMWYDLGSPLTLNGVNDYWKSDLGASLITL